MTAKEIERAKEELYTKYYGNNPRIPKYLLHSWTNEDMQLEKELACREMINCCLIYDSPIRYDDYDYHNDYEYKKYIASDSRGLSMERIDELIAEQRESFKKAIVSRDVFTDSEGVSYNSCDWGD